MWPKWRALTPASLKSRNFSTKIRNFLRDIGSSRRRCKVIQLPLDTFTLLSKKAEVEPGLLGEVWRGSTVAYVVVVFWKRTRSGRRHCRQVFCEPRSWAGGCSISREHSYIRYAQKLTHLAPYYNWWAAAAAINAGFQNIIKTTRLNSWHSWSRNEFLLENADSFANSIFDADTFVFVLPRSARQAGLAANLWSYSYNIYGNF